MVVFDNAFVGIFAGPPLSEIARDHAKDKQAAITWRDFSAAKLKELCDKNKPVLVICRADWDANGALLDRTLFTDRRVINVIKKQKYVPLLADCSNPSGISRVFFERSAGGRPFLLAWMWREPK